MKVNLISEVWKPVLGYEGLYEVSNFGRVRSLDRLVLYSNGVKHLYKCTILKQGKRSNGYLKVQLWKNGKMKTCSVHRLVYEAFNGTIPEDMHVNHINEIKTDNFVFVNPDGSVDLEKSNLNLMTPKENQNWGTGIQRRVEKQSKRVGQFTLDGVLVKEWQSTVECGRNGFNQGAVAACCRGEYKQYKGFIWAYV